MREPSLAEHYGDLGRQALALRFGMWVFLASELLLFSGFFALYGAYRAMYAHAFARAVQHNTLIYGTVNTYVLLTSSFTVALSVGAVRRGALRVASALLALSALLGVAFLAIKTAEYAVHIREGALPGHLLSLRGRTGQRWSSLLHAVLGDHLRARAARDGRDRRARVAFVALRARPLHGRLPPEVRDGDAVLALRRRHVDLHLADLLSGVKGSSAWRFHRPNT